MGSAQHQRKVCCVLVDRANYGRLKPVVVALHKDPRVSFSLVCSGTMVLERFDNAYKVVESDGVPVDEKLYMEMDGSEPVTMSKSIGLGILEFSSLFQRQAPDMVLLIGDRNEALAAAIAAAYMNITLVHVQGGEVSGSIDECARHAISKFAHYHVPATKRSAEYLVKMGERADTILATGCPSSDIAKALEPKIDAGALNSRGHGAEIDPTQPFGLCVFHPVTSEYSDAASQMEEVLVALHQKCMPTILLWPNIDAGSSQVAKTIRKFRDANPETSEWLRVMTNFEPDHYLALIAKASVLVGNSSSFVRDAGYFGTPTVLVGARQAHREMDEHVVKAETQHNEIGEAIGKQLAHGRYAPSTLYGDGGVTPRIVEAMVKAPLYSQKVLDYVHR